MYHVRIWLDLARVVRKLISLLRIMQGDGREEALLKHLQSLPELQNNPGTQPVLDAIHEFGKGENRYLMSVGDTKGTGIEKLINDKKPKVPAEKTSSGGCPTDVVLPVHMI